MQGIFNLITITNWLIDWFFFFVYPDNTSREDDVYLKLFTQEHEKLKELKSLRDKLNNTMEKENLLFNRFSQRLRESHQVN